MPACKIIQLSASDLIKKSAKTICYFRNKNLQQSVTPRMLAGTDHQFAVSDDSNLVEMRGTYEYNSRLLVHYTFDEIEKFNENAYYLIEHKYLEPGSVLEDWYVEYSIIQVAFYKSLHILNPKKGYYTAKFHRNQGNPVRFIDLKGSVCKAVLYLADKRYEIEPSNPQAIVKFYIDKALSSLGYESAIAFDMENKFKEWQELKRHIRYAGFSLI